MLQAIRDSAKGWISYVIVTLIAIPFAFWGVSSYFGTSGDSRVAAVVNGKEISAEDVQRAYYQQRERLRQMFGGRALPEFLDETTMRKQAREQLIRETLVFDTALRLGYGASDEQVAAAIRAIPAFQADGRFDNELYERRLRLQGMSPSGFELQMRQNIVSQQLSMGILGTEFVTTSELQDVERLERQEREFIFLTIAGPADAESIVVSDEEIEQHYKSHADNYRWPETVSLEYLELRSADLAKDVMPNEEELLAMYEERRSQLTVEEERSARHLLLQVDPEAEKAEIEDVRARAHALLEEIRGGRPFEELAREASDDTGSAEQGGDLGFFSRGMMVPEFDDVAFAITQGEVSEPVKSEFGFHLIEVTGIRPGGTKSFEDVRADLESEYRDRIGEQRFYDLSEELATLTYEQPDTLAAAADALELEIKTSEPFSRDGGAGIATHSKIREAAFSNDVLERGNNSELIELAPDHLVVLRRQEHEPERQKELAEVTEAIRGTLLKQRARELTRARSEAIRERLTDVASFRQAAEEAGVEFTEPGFVRRDAGNVDRQVQSEVFQLAAPSQGSLQISDLALPDGSYAIVGLVAIRDGKADDDGAAESENANKEALRAAAGRSEWKGLMQALRTEAEITINEEVL